MKTQLALVVAAAASLSIQVMAQTPLYAVHGNVAGGHVGHSVAWLDDIDGDGVRDFAVGAPDELVNGVARGVVRVYSGSTGLLLRTFQGVLDGEEFGASIAGIADRNGDGVGELMIGAPKNDFQYVDRGAAYVYSPVTGAPVVTYRGSVGGDQLGLAVANVGDLDADGVDDYAVGMPEATNTNALHGGRVQAFSGATGAASISYYCYDVGARTGAAIATAGDFDFDGYEDVLIGAPDFTGAVSHQGRAFVISGHTGATLKTWNGGFAGSQFGAALCALGDVDGDSRSEVAVGAPLATAGGINRGRVTVFHGGTGAYMYSVDGQDGWRLGSALACVGDWNASSAPDLAIGAPGFLLSGASDFGVIRIHDGNTGLHIASAFGYASNSAFASSLAAARLNGDNVSDLLVGAPIESKLASDAGSARVVISGAIKPYTYCTAKTNSLGCVPSIGYSGAASLSVGDNFHVTATNVLGQKAGMLFWGLAQTSVPYHGGTFCVAVPVVRTVAQSSNGNNNACDGNYDFHFGRAHMLAYGLTAGTIAYAQYWSRDPGFAHPDNVGFTNALRFEIAP